MIGTTREPSILDGAGDLFDSGAERAKDVVSAIAERAQDAVDTVDIDADAVRAGAARAIAGTSEREVLCAPAIEAAGDRLRLKTAIVTGVVAFALSALVFLAAREIARRGRERSQQRPASGQSAPARPGATPER